MVTEDDGRDAIIENNPYIGSHVDDISRRGDLDSREEFLIPSVAESVDREVKIKTGMKFYIFKND